MDLHDIGITRSSARTFGNDLVLEAAFRRHDTFRSLVGSEEGCTGGLAFFVGDAILLGPFFVVLLLEFHQVGEHDGIRHQVLCGILHVAFLESLDEQIDIQVDGIAGHQLEMSLIAKMGAKGIAVPVLIRHQVLLGARSLICAELITTTHEHGDSASCNNQFCLH